MYKAFICPHLEYAIQVSSLILSRDYQALESVQKLAVKFVKGLRHVPYETALQRLRLFSLDRRRIRGDLICTHKIMHDILIFYASQFFLPPPALGFAFILSRFPNNGVKPVTANIKLPEEIVNVEMFK